MKQTVADVMTAEVRTASPETPFRELASTIVLQGVAAIPVVDKGGRVLGIVSEADLLLKETGPVRAWLEGLAQRRKAEARTAAGLMSAPAVVIEPESGVADAARLMLRRRVKHLPVVDGGGKLVGIVSRGDLLKSFLRADEAIEADVSSEIRRILPAGVVAASVEVGLVRLTGRVPWHRDAVAAETAARAVDGVVAVENDIAYEADERDVAAAAAWYWG